MKPEDELNQELVEPDSDPGSFPAAQNTKPEPCKVSRKELHRRWLRYRPLHCQQPPIIPGNREDARYILNYPETGYTLHQPDARYILHQADTRYTPGHPKIGYTWHKPYIQHTLLISRRTPHA
jgi:hypothetical protein